MSRTALALGFVGFMGLTLLALAKQINEPTPSQRKFNFGFPEIKQTEATLDVPLLTYHYIREVTNPEEDQLGFALSVTPNDFREQMSYLAQNSYQTITPAELLANLKTGEPLPVRSVLLTFDDGYADFYTNAFPVLKEFNIKATVFVPAGFIANQPGTYMSWSQIIELDASGLITIASHTLSHAKLTNSNRARYELTQSKKVLESQLLHPVAAFAYPYGSFDDRVVAVVKQAGYEIAFTTKIGTALRYSERFALPRVRVSGGLEFSQFPGKLAPIPEPIKQPESVTP